MCFFFLFFIVKTPVIACVLYFLFSSLPVMLCCVRGVRLVFPPPRYRFKKDEDKKELKNKETKQERRMDGYGMDKGWGWGWESRPQLSSVELHA